MNAYTERALWSVRPSTPLQRLVLLCLTFYIDESGITQLTLTDLTALTCAKRKRVAGALKALQYKNLVVKCNDGYRLLI